MSCNFSSSTHVNFRRVSITEAMYERSHVNVKVARGSIFTSTRDIPCHSLPLFYCARKIYFTSVRTENYATVEIHPEKSFCYSFCKINNCIFFPIIEKMF